MMKRLAAIAASLMFFPLIMAYQQSPFKYTKLPAGTQFSPEKPGYEQLKKLADVRMFCGTPAPVDPNYKEFVIIIPSYNNQQWYERNVTTACTQNYPSGNVEVVYLNDASPDGTGNLVERLIQKLRPACTVTLVKNRTRCGALENLYRAITLTEARKVCVLLDGDDWFPDEHVLTRLNDIYSDKNIWLTYGQFEQYPSGHIGWCTQIPYSVVQNHSYRMYRDVPSHLRTFYAGLFHKIDSNDMLFGDECFCEFFSMAWDLAMMLPMLEMADGRFKFIRNVMYVYNCANPISDHQVSRKLQLAMDLLIRAKKPYEPLESLECVR